MNGNGPPPELVGLEAEPPRLTVAIPAPIPVPGEINIVGVKMANGEAYIRLTFLSPAFGAFVTHIPAEHAEEIAKTIRTAGREIRSGLIIPD